MKKQHYILFVIIMIIALMLSGCGFADSDTGSGIKGKAVLGPLQPVSQQGEENEKPYAGAVIIIKDSGGSREITRTKTAEDGTFSFNVPEGDYVVEGVSPDGLVLPYAAPLKVQVKKDIYTNVTVYFDTGIR